MQWDLRSNIATPDIRTTMNVYADAATPEQTRRNLLPMLRDKTLSKIVRDHSSENTRVGVDGSSERDFPKKLFALNSKRSE